MHDDIGLKNISFQPCFLVLDIKDLQKRVRVGEILRLTSQQSQLTEVTYDAMLLLMLENTYPIAEPRQKVLIYM